MRREPDTSFGAPVPVAPVLHVSALRDELPGREAVASALELLARIVAPPAATFGTVDPVGRPGPSAVRGSHLPPAELARAVERWRAELRGIDPLAPVRIAALPGRAISQRDVAEVRPEGLDWGRLRAAYRQIGVINDVWLPIRQGQRLIAGITLWRELGSQPWSTSQLRLIEALQPLIEAAYLSALRAELLTERLPDTLTPRQRQVARLLAAGASDPEVAQALRVSINTAKSHVRAVLEGLGVSSRREIVMYLAGAQPGATFPPAIWRPADPGRGRRTGTEPAGAVDVLRRRGGRCGGGRVGASVATAGPRRPRLGTGRRVVAPDLPAARQPAGGSPARCLAAAGVAAPAAGRPAPGVRRRPRDRGGPLRPAPPGPRPHREVIGVLRRLQPLLELTAAAPPLDPAPGTSTGQLADLPLTARERTVARLALAGEGNAAIARRLGISEGTTKNYMTSILAKCGVRSRTQLIAAFGAAMQVEHHC
jgi:DNA-binding NarL/FixJ family response regulator